ncbi:MAG: DUF4194 domain-containing protein [Deltaproteobacteria bacterium]|jgi:hypothetical protein|nr:DUF4194 domain-containing protein [Deltaproteobacteria bacterium]
MNYPSDDDLKRRSLFGGGGDPFDDGETDASGDGSGEGAAGAFGEDSAGKRKDPREEDAAFSDPSAGRPLREEEPEEEFDGDGDDFLDEEPGERLFSGDLGTYPVETRRLLVRLLRGPFLDGRAQSDLWGVLLREEDTVKRWLGEVFLELVVDTDSKTAFTRQLDTFEYKVPALLRKTRLTFLESILVTRLRRKLIEEGFKGQRAVVTGKEISGWLELFNKRKQNDPAGYQRQVASAMKKLQLKFKLLKKISPTAERYEISPALKLIFSPEEISALRDVYKELLKKEGLEKAETLEVPPPDAESAGASILGGRFASGDDDSGGYQVGVFFEDEEPLEKESEESGDDFSGENDGGEENDDDDLDEGDEVDEEDEDDDDDDD